MEEFLEAALFQSHVDRPAGLHAGAASARVSLRASSLQALPPRDPANLMTLAVTPACTELRPPYHHHHLLS